MSDVEVRRRRILIGAYACGPGAEPEASAGWAIARAAAHENDVWVVTRRRFRDDIERALDEEPELRAHLTVTYLDLASWVMRQKRRPWDLYWYYPLWQRALGRRAAELHREIGFDVVHHATFANDWMPSGLSTLSDVPFVWGPVGGASTMPLLKLKRWLGARGVLTELLRAPLTALSRHFFGHPTARRAQVMIAQNPEVARHFEGLGVRTIVEPNASLVDLPLRPSDIARRTTVFAGRLIAWKGASLAIDAIAHLCENGNGVEPWRLIIFGAGYQRRALERRAARKGVADRVEFRGHRSREEVLRTVAASGVFLFPSMRDQAGWVAAEASSMGCPVVTLPLGGPPLLAEPNAHVASLNGDIVANVAHAVVEASSAGGTPHHRWASARLPEKVSAWYHAAVEASEGEGAVAMRRARRLRILESYREPRSTTNPYIVQLHDAITSQPAATVMTFSHRRALWGSYGIVHLHWPELLVGGHTRRGRLARRVATALILARWRAARPRLVRTVHNLERPGGMSRYDHWVLDCIDRMTACDIRLNDHTPARAGIPAVTIPHGHYRDWFAPFETASAIPGRITYVGLVRRYKGVESLIAAFSAATNPELSLVVAGKPSTTDLEHVLLEAAEKDHRVTVAPRFLDDAELVQAITSSELIVLPYRHMHNSGTALAALSLDRPILVPDNQVNRDLSREVGPGWVHLFEGELTARVLEETLVAARSRSGRPDLSGRGWEQSGQAHVATFDRVRA